MTKDKKLLTHRKLECLSCGSVISQNGSYVKKLPSCSCGNNKEFKIICEVEQ